MIYECLLAPHENPSSVRDIKRALITYDKIKIIDPSDRDLLPSNQFLRAAFPSMSNFLSINHGPVRPMGKALGYDDRFNKILEDFKPAVQQGLIETVSTYDQKITDVGTIGYVPNGGYPLKVDYVLQLFRTMAKDQNFLHSAIVTNEKSLLEHMHISEHISLSGIGDGGINNNPALPNLLIPSYSEAQSIYISQIARARIGAFIKYAGFCHLKKLIPVFPSEVYGGIVKKLLTNTSTILSDIETNDNSLMLKNSRILEFYHEEFINDDILDKLSVTEVIKLRTKLWCKHAIARESLFDSINAISQEISDNSEFDKQAKSILEKYRKESVNLEMERGILKFKIKCDVGKALLGLACGQGVLGSLTQMQLPTNIAVTLALGGIYAFETSKDYIPDLKRHLADEANFKRSSGFGLHNFHTKLVK